MQESMSLKYDPASVTTTPLVDQPPTTATARLNSFESELDPFLQIVLEIAHVTPDIRG